MAWLEKRVKLNVQLPGWWKNYDPCGVLLVPTSVLFAYVLHVLIEDLLGRIAMYRAALTDHCVIFVMVFLQWVHSEDEILRQISFRLILDYGSLCTRESCFRYRVLRLRSFWRAGSTILLRSRPIRTYLLTQRCWVLSKLIGAEGTVQVGTSKITALSMCMRYYIHMVAGVKILGRSRYS